jgi:metallophosphoesterase (TIGR00282 family)
MHAEATSEKVALGWFLDGKVSAVLGTHTHIQTADERVLPRGTAYITDVGMTGPYDSVIGRAKDKIIERFLTGGPTRFEIATGDVELHGAIVEIDPATGRALSIRRVREKAPQGTAHDKDPIDL